MMIMVIIRLWREIWSIEMERVSTREKTRNVRTKITDITLKNIKSLNKYIRHIFKNASSESYYKSLLD